MTLCRQDLMDRYVLQPHNCTRSSSSYEHSLCVNITQSKPKINETLLDCMRSTVRNKSVHCHVPSNAPFHVTSEMPITFEPGIHSACVTFNVKGNASQTSAKFSKLSRKLRILVALPEDFLQDKRRQFFNTFMRLYIHDTPGVHLPLNDASMRQIIMLT